MVAPRDQIIQGDHSIVAGRDVHIGRLEVHVSAKEDAQDRRELPRLLRTIRRDWLEGVLDESVPRPVPTDFELAGEGMVVPRWPERDDLPRAAARRQAAGAPVDVLFDDANRFLLILGAEGSGKTTALLHLARCLVERAEHDLEVVPATGSPAPPTRVPVFFSLVTWTAGVPLLEWMVSELVKLRVPDGLARRWLEQRRLTILLDGLDEVDESRRGDCVVAINAFLDQVCPDGMAVCSRREEYRAQPQRLKLDSAVCISPLSPEQVDAYLSEGGARLEGLRDVLGRDPVMRQLACSPLLLNTMLLAYEGGAGETELDRPDAETPSSRALLFERYVQRTIEVRGRAMTARERVQTLQSLAWLADRMLGREDVLRVEAMQPSWLPTGVERVAYALVSRALVGLLLGAMLAAYARLVDGLFYPSPPLRDPSPVFVLVGVVFGLAVGVVDCAGFASIDPVGRTSVGEPWWKTAARILLYGVLYGALLELTGIGAFWVVSGWPVVLLFAMRGRYQSLETDVRPATGLRWSWRAARRGGALGVLVGLAMLGIQGALSGIEALRSGWQWPTIVAILGGGLGSDNKTVDDSPTNIRGLTLVLRVARRGGRTIGGLSTGLGFLLSFVAAAVLALKLSLFHVPYVELEPLVTPWLTLCFFLGAAGALLGVLWYGGADAIQHAVLRALLWARSPIPWRLESFLDVSTRLRLLQRAGGGYRFMHGAFMEHLAGRVGAGRRATAPSDASRPRVRSAPFIAALRAYGIGGALFAGSCAVLIRAHAGKPHDPWSFRSAFDEKAAAADCAASIPGACNDLAAHRRKGCDLLFGSACADLGSMVEDGTADRPDGTGALVLFRKACALGSHFGCYRLARARAKTPREEGFAQEAAALKTMCDDGDAWACFNLGSLRDTAPGDVREAVDLYARACDAGHAGGCLKLGTAYRFGRGEQPISGARAADLYERACDGGIAAGCYFVGTLYAYGSQDLLPDAARAADLYEQACHMGSPEGCNSLGQAYQYGLGNRGPDAERAVALYEEACDEGSTVGCVNLGLAYQQGQGSLPTDEVHAVALWEKACDAGDALGCTDLGVAYQSGQGGLPTNYARAAALYQGACDAGNALGCANLGVMYQHGYGVLPPDDKQAVALFAGACDAGLPRGCANLAFMVEHGLGGLEKAPPQAVTLYEQACDAGDPYACSGLELARDSAHPHD